MSLDEQWKTATSIMWYVANRSPEGMLRDLFGERRADDPYAAEWLARFRSRDFAAIFGKLDYPNQLRFLRLVIRAYADDAEANLARAQQFHPGAAGEAAERRPSSAVERLTADENLSPTFRKALKDAGRGHLLR